MAVDNVKDTNRKRFLAVMRLPIFLVVVNYFFVNTLFAFLPYSLGNISYNIFRIAIIFYAGWLVVRKDLGRTWHAALAGILIYFVDHVVCKGSVFLLNYFFKPDGLGLAAFSGVLVSFIVFIPLAMIVGAVGGLAARSTEH